MDYPLVICYIAIEAMAIETSLIYPLKIWLSISQTVSLPEYVIYIDLRHTYGLNDRC